MTREAKLLIDMWNTLHKEYHKVVTEENYDILKKGIKALEQEPCNDCVSRQMVTDAVENTIAKYIPIFIGRYEKIPLELAMAVKELPPVTPTQRWIPVSERLPEENSRYLAYIVNKHDASCRYIMTCEYVEGDVWCWYPDDDCASDNVLAWMPLPEPYEPKESV